MMEKDTKEISKTPSPEWFVRGILTRIGESFDRLTGRHWQPSSIATSELIERLSRLLDSNVDDRGPNGRFVPHVIKLKVQWDKFSSDSEELLSKLKDELHTAAIDHINDNRYHTLAPIDVEVKPDYFTKGIQLTASFGDTVQEAEMNVSLPQVDLRKVAIAPAPAPKPEKEFFVAQFFAGGKPQSVRIGFVVRQRKSVGRGKENDLTIDDASVSKVHATLYLNEERRLLLADTGSANGTFINGNRIPYGKAIALEDSDRVTFGNVEVLFRCEDEIAGNDSAESSITVSEESSQQLSFESTAAEIPAVSNEDNADDKILELGDEFDDSNPKGS